MKDKSSKRSALDTIWRCVHPCSRSATFEVYSGYKVADRTWLILREHGAMAEEAVEDGGDAGGGIESSYDEKVVLPEKVEDSGAHVPVAVNLREHFRDVG
jgi:hypothetical protein